MAIFQKKLAEESVITSEKAQRSFLNSAHKRDYILLDPNIVPEDVINEFLDTHKSHRILFQNEKEIKIKRYNYKELEKLEENERNNFPKLEDNGISDTENEFLNRKVEENNISDTKTPISSTSKNIESIERENRENIDIKKREREKGENFHSHVSGNLKRRTKKTGGEPEKPKEPQYTPEEFKQWINENPDYMQDTVKIVQNHTGKRTDLKQFNLKVKSILDEWNLTRCEARDLSDLKKHMISKLKNELNK
jgi:hypothetical protein